MLDTYRFPVPSKASPVGPFSPLAAKSPRSSPFGENSRTVLPSWLATNRFCADTGATARQMTTRRVHTVNVERTVDSWCIGLSPFELVGRCGLPGVHAVLILAARPRPSTPDPRPCRNGGQVDPAAPVQSGVPRQDGSTRWTRAYA